MTIPLSIDIFQRGTSGVPDTTPIGVNLGARADSYQHTISDRFGFESMQVSFKCSVEEAVDWLANGLMRSAIVYGPDANVVWEGYINTASARIGQKPATLSLDTMANRVRCTYTTVLGTPGTTSSVSDADSQALYGKKDRVVSLNQDTAAAAANKADVVLVASAFPRSNEATQAMTGAQGEIQITLSFVGWYQTLEWVVFNRTSTSSTAISTQVAALINTSGVGIGAINNFLSSSTVNIMTLSNTATEYVVSSTTYREKIEALLSQGDGTDPVTWGVYEDRMFTVAAWAGALPTTITYYEHLGTGDVYNSAGTPIAPWDVRPNAMSEVVELLDIGPPANAPDAAARKYVGRVTCSISGDQIGCTLEPPGYAGVDAILASMVRS